MKELKEMVEGIEKIEKEIIDLYNNCIIGIEEENKYYKSLYIKLKKTVDDHIECEEE